MTVSLKAGRFPRDSAFTFESSTARKVVTLVWSILSHQKPNRPNPEGAVLNSKILDVDALELVSM
eukprot:4301888-Amphidinium_carterae.1